MFYESKYLTEFKDETTQYKYMPFISNPIYRQKYHIDYNQLRMLKKEHRHPQGTPYLLSFL